MERLSCRLCVLATRTDLVCAARLSPALAEEYAAAEVRLGRTFPHGRSIAGVRDEAAAQGPLALADAVPGAAPGRHLDVVEGLSGSGSSCCNT